MTSVAPHIVTNVPCVRSIKLHAHNYPWCWKAVFRVTWRIRWNLGKELEHEMRDDRSRNGLGSASPWSEQFTDFWVRSSSQNFLARAKFGVVGGWPLFQLSCIANKMLRLTYRTGRCMCCGYQKWMLLRARDWTCDVSTTKCEWMP